MKKVLMVICMLSTGSLCWAQATAPSLGTAATFAVLGSSNVTCTATPSGVISGDVGVSPGSFTNTPPCLVVGTVHQGADPAASNALLALNTAYQNALVANSSCTLPLLLAAPPASFTLSPGVYCNMGAAGLTFTNITLTLDAGGNANAVWVFKIDAGLTGTGFQVVMAGGGQPCNVYWLVGADSTLTTSTFQGNILTGPTGSFTSTGGTLIGRVLASVAVTLTGPNVHGTCALAAQGGASCKNDDDDRDEDKDHHDRDDDRDKDHHRHHDKDRDDHDRDHKDNDHRDHD